MILNQHTIARRAQCEDLVKDLQQLSQEIGHKELAAVVGELRLRMVRTLHVRHCRRSKSGQEQLRQRTPGIKSGDLRRGAPAHDRYRAADLIRRKGGDGDRKSLPEKNLPAH